VNKPEMSTAPVAFKLHVNYPNPFNAMTKIVYEIPKSVNVTLKVYDVLGREAAVLVNNEVKSAGIYEGILDAKTLASGVYFYRIQAGDFVESKKMVVVK
jgi:hypothetical protein